MKEKNIKSITETLTNANVKPTAQRIAVFQYIYNESDHPTPEKIKDAVDQVFPKISLATVYNTLNVLVEANLIKAIKIPSSGKVVYDANTSKHYHFINESNGQLIDIDANDISLQLSLPQEFKIKDVDIFIKGHYQG